MAIAELLAGLDHLFISAAGKACRICPQQRKENLRDWSGERSRLHGRNCEFDLPRLLRMTFQPVEAVRAQQNEVDQKCENHEEGEQSHQSSARIK
jgi:hypothetical protein